MLRTNKRAALATMLPADLAEEDMTDGTIIDTAPTTADFTFHDLNLGLRLQWTVKLAQYMLFCNPGFDRAWAMPKS
jgi:hypothetical protein